MISTHILDTSLGNPAEGVGVVLETLRSGAWVELSHEKTNKDGRATFGAATEAGKYRLQFQIESYYRGHGKKPFFLDAQVAFEITDLSRKYHVPLLLNPYGYSTYRGS